MPNVQELESGARFRFLGNGTVYEVVEKNATFRAIESGHPHTYYQSSVPELVIKL